ncbi:MAG: efflux RND transporter periplasmic adaptor subunit [Gammaproteobacteria bacterium]|nr:efflux RND transporter periplasmic adaptor subunit [Gammaproteobacteria bacterium]
MSKNILYTLLVAIIGGTLIVWLLLAEPHHDDHDVHAHGDYSELEEESDKGPLGGRLLKNGDFALEITLFEKGVPPEFHLYSYDNDKLINPADVTALIKLTRLDGQVDTFNFTPQADFLRGDGIVTEPHSFDVSVEATFQGKQHSWRYNNYEGRVQIASDIAAKSGVKTEIAGPRSIQENLNLTGRIEVDPNRLSQVRARFPGMVKQVKRELGDRVNRGDVLAEIQSNESLQTYQVTAPISGVIVQRDVQVGETTVEAPLFIIADLTKVWAELDVFNQDISRVQAGQSVVLETLSGEEVTGKVDWLSPMTAHASQSIQARVVVNNKSLKLRPGQFIRGRITVAEHEAPLAVRKSGIQAFRDFQVVFAQIGDTYEVRMLELGREDHDWVEVLGGLKPGTKYVTENSYLIKADIEKSGASHDH